MDWFDQLPEDCPPEDVQAPSGTVVRLVAQDPPAASDFVSLAELRPDKDWESPELDCQARGLSVFTDQNHAARISRRVPAMRDRLLAEADISGAEGVVKQTGSTPSHHTWWVPTGYSPAGLFTVLESG